MPIRHTRCWLWPWLVVAIVAQAGCGTSNLVPGFLKPYRYDLPQGNYITQEMVGQLKPGMTRDQVKFLLGTPLITDAFRTDRWDYVFRLQKADGKVEFSRYAVIFKDEKLLSHGGGPLPSESSGSSLAASTLPDAPAESPSAPSTSPALGIPPDVPPAGPPVPELSASTPVPARSDPEPTRSPGQAGRLARVDKQELAGQAAPELNESHAAIFTLLDGWSQAWSKKDVDTYLTFYAANFQHGMQSRAFWENFRRSRLTAPRSIRVEVQDVRIRLLSTQQAVVTFTQRYASNVFQESGMKTLDVVQVNGQWKIYREKFVVQSQ